MPQDLCLEEKMICVPQFRMFIGGFEAWNTGFAGSQHLLLVGDRRCWGTVTGFTKTAVGDARRLARLTGCDESAFAARIPQSE